MMLAVCEIRWPNEFFDGRVRNNTEDG